MSERQQCGLCGGFLKAAEHRGNQFTCGKCGTTFDCGYEKPRITRKGPEFVADDLRTQANEAEAMGFGSWAAHMRYAATWIEQGAALDREAPTKEIDHDRH